MPSRQVSASVVIATYRRPQLVQRLLQALTRQQAAPFQVVVVEQGEPSLPSGTTEGSTAFSLDYVCITDVGLPHARNVGIQRARGEWICFIDDDAVPEPGWVARHLSHAADPRVGGVGGRVLEDAAAGGARQRRRVRTGTIRTWDAYPFSGFDAEVPCEVQHVMGCNMSFRTSCLAAVGGFDERFGGTAEFEELDLCLRIRQSGYQLLFDPSAVVRHARAATGGCRLPTARQAFYWLHHNHQLLFLKHFPRGWYPWFLVEVLGRIGLRSLLVRDPAYVVAGLKGVLAGVATYRRAPRPVP